LFFSDLQFKNLELNQKWYSCEQCNRAWKTITAERMMQQRSNNNNDNSSVVTGKSSQSGAAVNTKSLVVCEPCIARCHDRHKGVRFLYEAPSSRVLQCMCLEVCKVINTVCSGVTISAGQIRTQDAARNKRMDMEREVKRNKKFPPIFACVPRQDRNGKEKLISGWHMCRTCIPKKINENILQEESTTAQELLVDEKSEEFSRDNDDDNGMESSTTDDDDSDEDDNDNSTATDDDANTVSTNESENLPPRSPLAIPTKPSKRVSNTNINQNQLVPFFGQPPSMNKTDKKKKKKDDDSLSTYMSLHSEEPNEEAVKQMGFANDLILPIYLLKRKWLELYDVEEPEHLRYGDQVLCSKLRQPFPKITGRVKTIVRPGFYLIRYDNRALGDEIYERSRVELISRPKFYFNIYTAEVTWIREDIISAKEELEREENGGLGEEDDEEELSEEQKNSSSNNLKKSITQTQSMQIPGPLWLTLYENSDLRRNFDEYDEMYHPILNIVYYINFPVYKEELSALRLQKIFREKFFKKRRFTPWKSFAFSVDTPEKVKHLMKVKFGWAYLRRRAISCGEFLDENGIEWEENIDKITSEYFYWAEEDNLYSWDKPNVFQRKKEPVNKFKLNEEVLYRFPGRRTEEVALVIKIRFDDETGEDVYDLQHKYNPSLLAKWIPRIQIKPVPMEGDALMLAKMEVKWKQVIRRQREADERKRHREKEIKAQEELKRMELMNSMAYKLMGEKALQEERGGLNQTTRIMRSRMERIRLEEIIRNEEIDRTEGQARRDKIQQQIDDMKASLGKRLTRADVLNITRSIEMKFMMNEKIEKRNALQEALSQLKRDKEDRQYSMEQTLLEREVQMTTPRSLNRRKVIRRIHMAMKRQEESLIICEWGCGDWFHVGYEQQDHQSRRCPKRILPCTLGCEVKNTEEYWLAPHVDCTPTVVGSGLGGFADDNRTISTASSIPSSPGSSVGSPPGSPGGGDSVSNPNSPSGSRSTKKRKAFKSKKSIKEINKSRGSSRGSTKESLTQLLLDENMEKKLLGTITNQQYHETQECTKRLVMCPLQCLEWISVEILDHHMKELCTKRPAKPLICRLGCGKQFGGRIEMLIQAEDDRLQHETEECDFRTVRCNWCFDDGRVCAAQMKANERMEHRDYHLNALGIINYTVPGVYIYKVPKNISRMKIQLWGAGGGGGYFYQRQGGQGGGGGFIEAIVDLEPFTVLEITVGGGGKAGVRGTEIDMMDLKDMKEIVAKQREFEKALPGDQRSRSLVPQIAVIDSQCGVTLGGSPGGNKEHYCFRNYVLISSVFCSFFFLK
jgi:hypothetical protein